MCVHVWCPPTLSVPFHRAKATEEEGYYSVFGRERKNLRGEERENAGSWIIEQITFVWVQGERERPREREIHPLFFHALSGTWEATGESDLWPIEVAATSLGRQRVDP